MAEDLFPGGRPVLVAQNQQQAAQLTVRIQELEDQVRTLTGQIEGLQFQMTQMQQLIDRMTKDNEFRFEQLEGGNTDGKGGAPVAPAPKANTQGALPEPAAPMPAAPLPGAAQPAAPASPEAAAPTATAEAPPQGSIQTLPPLANGDAGDSTTDQAALGPDQPMDLDLGQSQDPLLNGGNGTLGTLDDQDLGGRPLDLSAPGADKISSGDAKAQYAAGYDAMTRGDYAFAEDQFQQFIALYPDDPQAPDATNWLGEALLQRRAYTDAAQVLADGYTKYKTSKRAPDMMLKLGIALEGADQHDVACRTFSTLKQRYPNLAPAFRDRLNAENSKAKCPPIG